MGADDNTLRYIESCKAAATDYIARTTRTGANDVRILDARAGMHRFPVTLTHRLAVETEVQEHHGEKEPASGDFSTQDGRRYKQEVLAQTRAELARGESIDALIESVRSERYGALAERTRLRTHPRRLHHLDTCASCQGKGEGSCNNCHGRGEDSCSTCGSDGKVSCSRCGGSGSVTETTDVMDDNGATTRESRSVDCGNCSGGRADCSHCGGSGKRTCGTCGGSGTVSCNACSGYGCVTKISTTHTYTTPEFAVTFPAGTPKYVRQILDRVGHPALGQYGSVQLREATPAHARAEARFVYDCTLPCCELTLEIRGRRFRWVLFGTTPQVFDADGALEALVQADFDALGTVAQGRGRWSPLFHWAARRAVSAFMASALNRTIVDATAAGKSDQAIVDEAQRAVSVDYVRTTLERLRSTIKVAAWWSRVKWVAALNVLAVPMPILALVCRDRHLSRPFAEPAARYFLGTPASFGFDWRMALWTLLLTVPGAALAIWTSRHWLQRSGGAGAVAWARREKLLLGVRTGALAVVSAAMLTGIVYGRWPLWVDGQGKVYGTLALFDAPVIAKPFPKFPVDPVTELPGKDGGTPVLVLPERRRPLF